MRAIETLISACIGEQERRERVMRRGEQREVASFVRSPISRQLDQGHAGQQDGHAE